MVSELQLNILEILAGDARIPAAQIALMTGRPEAEIVAAVSELEKKRVIVNYPATINWDLVDKDEVEALIEVRVTPQRGEGFDAIAERIYRFEEVNSVYLMSGAYDLMVLIRGRTMKQLALFVAEKLSTLEHVNSTATHFVLKKYKYNGVILAGTADDARLVVTP